MIVYFFYKNIMYLLVSTYATNWTSTKSEGGGKGK